MKVCAIAAISADGYIGLDENHLSTSWTSKADARFFVRKTKEIGTVVMGRTTFATFNKALAGRRLIIYTHRPELLHVDGVEATSEPPEQLIARLQAEGVQAVAICGGASIYTQFMNAGLVDELYLTIMPKLFGRGLALFNEVVDQDLHLLETTPLEDGSSVLLHYQIQPRKLKLVAK